MNASGDAQWMIKLDIATHQTKVVLRMCTKIDDLLFKLEFLRTDCKYLFQQTKESHYLEWFVNVLFCMREDIVRLKSGEINDTYHQEEVIKNGWLDRFSVQNENGIEYPKYSIMCIQYQLRLIKDLDSHLKLYQDISHFKTEMQKKLTVLKDQIQKALIALDKAEMDAKTMLHECTTWNPFYWKVEFTEFPVSCMTIRRNSLMETIVLDKSYFLKHRTFTPEYTRAHLIEGSIPDMIAGSGQIKHCLNKRQQNEENDFLCSRLIAHEKFQREEARLECEEARLVRQHSRFVCAYAPRDDIRSLLVKRKVESGVMPAVQTNNDEECEF